uniref:acyltransferase family protein n=1 Tax=Acidisphaera sp. L21 TaxID=1641851 RepID=UPI00131E9DF7
DISGPLGVFHRFVFTTELPGMLDEFAIGILIARFIRSPMGGQFTRYNQHRFWAAPLASLILLTLTLQLYWANAAFWDSFWMVVAFRSLMAATCGAVVLTACCFNVRVLVRATAPLRYLGTISYGIYLWHLPIILSFHRLDWLTGPRALPYILALTVLTATASWHLFEKPLLQRLARKSEASSIVA